MKDLGKIMQQAQEMQAKMQDAQAKIEATEADGVSGAGLVTVRLKGKGELVSVKIDPSLMSDDAEILEDLIKAAHGDAKRRLDQAMEAAMKEATAGLGGGLLPGFKLPF
jgi:DNA-binding YbaB/EbfC family protein